MSGTHRGARHVSSFANHPQISGGGPGTVRAASPAQPRRHASLRRRSAATCVEIKFTGRFVLNQRITLHAIDATPARRRGDVTARRSQRGHVIAEK